MNEWPGVISKAARAAPALANRVPRAAAAAGSAANAGRAVAAVTGGYCLFVSLLYYDTLVSMVSIWLRSQTFTHGFLILPISLWLTWRRRDRFDSLSVKPEPRALLLLLAAGLAWLLAHLVEVQVIGQLAFVTILVSGIWAIVGNAVVRCYAFPLGFLFLAVPMGAGLIPPLMELTADTTEFLLRASGVPVFREGMYLSLPTGTWSVIEECSGVRYLIASFTLGLVYAHLVYHSLWRRVAFMGLAIIVPILANCVRAYTVVMVGHLSDMRYGVGADHLYFGWLLFGLAMLLMFWLGGFWQQAPLRPQVRPAAKASYPDKPALVPLLACAMALLCAAIWPGLALSMNRTAGPAPAGSLVLPDSMGDWALTSGVVPRWAPVQPGADLELDRHFASGSLAAPATVGIHVRQYLQQQPGAELITPADPWRPDRLAWRVIEKQQIVIDLDRSTAVDEVQVVSTQHRLLVWSWYRINGRNTANTYVAKFLETLQRIVDGRRQGARIFLVTSIDTDAAQARLVLRDFVAASHGAIEQAVDRNGESPVPGEGVAE